MSVHRDEVPMAPDAVKPPMPVGALPVVPGQAPGLVDQSAKNNINFHDQLDEARDLMKVVVANRGTPLVDLEAAMVEARNDLSFGVKPKLEPSVKIGIQRPVKGGNNLFDGLSANSDLKARGRSIPLEQRKNAPIAATPAFMGYPVRMAAVPSEPTKSTNGAHVNGDMPARPATEAEMVKIAAQIEAGRAKAEAAGRKLNEAILAEHGVRLDLAGRLAKAAQRALIAKHEHEDLDGGFDKEFDIQPRCERCDLDLALSALVLEWLLVAE